MNDIQNEQYAKIFKALCDPTRIAVVKILRSGEHCNCVLSELLDIAQSKLSYHMKILCESGIVTCRHAGKWSHYRINDRGAQEAIRIFHELTDVEEIVLQKEA